MHFPNIFKRTNSDKSVEKTGSIRSEDSLKQQHLPKGFANDVMRTSKTPDTLYGFDDPMARRLGPVPTSDPTNTGA
jgi:hypothetical protein